MTAPSTVERLVAWEALDSRGTPTVGCEITLAGGARGVATVPSGASTGRHEACELRDGGDRYGGRGVRTAVANANGEIAELLRGVDAAVPGAVDDRLIALDGESRFARLGANAVLAVSVAAAIAAADHHGEPLHRWVSGGAAPRLPMPMVNVLSGGAHAGRLIDVQDFLVVPIGASTFAEAIEWAARVRTAAAELLAQRGHSTALVADEGGVAAPLASNRDALGVLAAAIEAAGLDPGTQAAIAIDVAATQLVAPGGYRLASEGRTLRAADLVGELRSWAEEHPVVSIEDALGEDDWEGWSDATARLGHMQLLGDDLFVTDPSRLARGAAEGIANAVLVKPNQNGTLSGTLQVIDLARHEGYATVLSARSGETEDVWLADLAAGWDTGQIKVGSTTRSERTAKWNRLLQIEATDADAVFVGRAGLPKSIR